MIFLSDPQILSKFYFRTASMDFLGYLGKLSGYGYNITSRKYRIG